MRSSRQLAKELHFFATASRRSSRTSFRSLASSSFSSLVNVPRELVHLHLLRPGLTNAEVKLMQRALQRSLGFTGHDADGVPGKRSLAALGLTALA